MNRLKAKIKIACNTCGCTMNRVKTIKVTATDKTSAMIEAGQKANQWKKSLAGTNCRICQSIIDMKP